MTVNNELPWSEYIKKLREDGPLTYEQFESLMLRLHKEEFEYNKKYWDLSMKSMETWESDNS